MVHKHRDLHAAETGGENSLGSFSCQQNQPEKTCTIVAGKI